MFTVNLFSLYPLIVSFFLENGMYMFLWIGLSVRSDWCMEIFGVQSAGQIDTDTGKIPLLNNPANERLRNLLQGIQATSPTTIRVSNCAMKLILYFKFIFLVIYENYLIYFRKIV